MTAILTLHSIDTLGPKNHFWQK